MCSNSLYQSQLQFLKHINIFSEIFLDESLSHLKHRRDIKIVATWIFQQFKTSKDAHYLKGLMIPSCQQAISVSLGQDM